jgi:hypothetical protein
VYCSSLAGHRLACQCRAGHWDSGAEAEGHCSQSAYRQRLAAEYGKKALCDSVLAQAVHGLITEHAGAGIGRARAAYNMAAWVTAWQPGYVCGSRGVAHCLAYITQCGNNNRREASSSQRRGRSAVDVNSPGWSRCSAIRVAPIRGRRLLRFAKAIALVLVGSCRLETWGRRRSDECGGGVCSRVMSCVVWRVGVRWKLCGSM